MKTQILVALLLLQLSIIIYGTNGYKFGDMISFPRFKACVTPIYKHFAVFVNDKEFPNKKPGEDIFHLTPSGGCHFGKLSDEPEQALSNYPDVTHVDNDAKIEARILEKIKTCGKYNLLTNNCEHLATYVRYGVASTKQHGATAQAFTRVCKQGKPITQTPVDLESPSCEAMCSRATG